MVNHKHSTHLMVFYKMYDKLTDMVKTFPIDKVLTLSEDNSISCEEAKRKVALAANSVSKHEGLALETAIDKILCT